MIANAHEKAKFALNEAHAQVYRELEYNYPWALESTRWHELVFALLTSVTSQPQRRVRAFVTYLGGLYLHGRPLLDIPTLAEIPRAGQGPDNEHVREIGEKI